MSCTYEQAGVSITEGNQFVRYIRKAVRSTYSKNVLSDIGSFGAFYDARFKHYQSPVLVSSVDGVGTKLLIAQMMNRHDTIGQDLVNHCVNDVLVCGAQPLFFLDYFATGRLRKSVARDLIAGFVKACKVNNCSLIGGETAEMPGLYNDDEYDLSGTIVGIVEKKAILTGKKIKKGDVLIGLPSSGLHTNGYSLARAVLLKIMRLQDYVEELGCSLGEALLSIHRSYLGVVLPVLSRFSLHGLAHITGGGIVGNTSRIVPAGLGLRIDWKAWERPAIFRMIQQLGKVPEHDMQRTFNLGIGLVMVVPQKAVVEVLEFLRNADEGGFVIGEVVSRATPRR